MKDKIKEASSYIEENGKVLSIIVTVMSVILTNGFKLCANMFHEGRYDYWGIPKDFMVVDYEETLFSFLGAMIVISFVLLIVYIHCLWLDLVKENNKKWIKVIKIMGVLGIAPIVLAIVLLYYLGTQIPVSEILIYLKTSPLNFAGHVVSVSILYYILMFGSKLMYTDDKDVGSKKMESTEGKDEKVKGSVISDKIFKIAIFTAVAMFFVGILLTENALTDIGKSSMNMISELSVVEVDGECYVITEQQNDYWIVKECLRDGDELIINYEHYMVMDIAEKNIFRVSLDNGRTISSCMVDGEEFAKNKEMNK